MMNEAIVLGASDPLPASPLQGEEGPIADVVRNPSLAERQSSPRRGEVAPKASEGGR